MRNLFRELVDVSVALKDLAVRNIDVAYMVETTPGTYDSTDVKLNLNENDEASKLLVLILREALA